MENTTLNVGQPVACNLYGREGYIVSITENGKKQFVLSGGMRPITKNVLVAWGNATLSELDEYTAARYADLASHRDRISKEQAAQLLKEAQLKQEAGRRARMAEIERQEERRKAFADEVRAKMPADTKAVIIAELHENISDSMTDYFASKTTKTLILAWSTHTRDLFTEMRKAALNAPETAEMAEIYDEHREKYSMGAGYYLTHKGGGRYSGWHVKKCPLVYRKGDEPKAESVPVGEWRIPSTKPTPKASAPQSSGGFRVEEHTHTKKGFQMFIVVVEERVDRAQYDAWLEQAKALGGWYSRKWGSTPGGFAFKDKINAEQFLAGITDDGTPTDPTPTKGNKLREMAAKMQPTIDAKLGERLTNTPKRLAQANHAKLEGERLQRTQAALMALAALHDAGAVPSVLAGVTTRQAIYDLVGTKTEMTPNGYHAYSHCTGQPRLDTPEALAVWALLKPKSAEQKAAEEVQRKIDGLKFSAIPDYFPTPAWVVEKMIAHANISPASNVLEPSAGSGAILDLIPPCEFVGAFERSHTLCEILKAKYPVYSIVNDDFLEQSPEDVGLFDAVLMNPPFSNGADIKHILHAATFLTDGGTLVAICANGPKQRAELMPIADYWEDLPLGTFKEAGTNVNAALLVLKG